jgi:CheY-like chemotaxis protein
MLVQLSMLSFQQNNTVKRTSNFQLILIDDNEIDQLLHSKIVKILDKDIQIVKFMNAPDALTAIKNEVINVSNSINIILLDIKMPLMDGFQFLDAYKLLDDKIKNNYFIYLLSSSLNQYDISRSKSNPLVIDMILKPLTAQILLNLLNK